MGGVGDFERFFVALEGAEDAAGNAGEHGDGRVIGVDADADIVFHGDRGDAADEVFVVVPEFGFGVDAAVGEGPLEDLAGPEAFAAFGHVVATGGGGTAGGFAVGMPDAVAHVGVGDVLDIGLAAVLQVLLVGFDAGVAAGEVEDDLLLVAVAVVADVPDAEAGRFDAGFDAEEVFDVVVFAVDGDGGVANADLIGELEVFVGGIAAELHGHFDAGGPGDVLVSGGGGGLDLTGSGGSGDR